MPDPVLENTGPQVRTSRLVGCGAGSSACSDRLQDVRNPNQVRRCADLPLPQARRCAARTSSSKRRCAPADLAVGVEVKDEQT